MKKISVIIPMYNSEPFIRTCLRSVMNQTCHDLEIVVVDDGSADQGAQICREMSRQDDRICLYQQANRGVSGARNLGLDMASGDYVFFLDSDDAIHSCLLEELLQQAEKKSAELVFCSYRKLDTCRFDRSLEETYEGDGSFLWEMAEGSKAEEWFHIRYVQELAGIGGKLIHRSLIGDLRFDEELANGEDTWFLYQLVCRQIRVARLCKQWYYYRMHPQSATHATTGVKAELYFESLRRMRDQEIRRGHSDYAVTWENLIVQQMERNYRNLKENRNRAGCMEMKKTAAMERKSPLFGRLYFSARFLFWCCFCCYPLYDLLSRIVSALLYKKGTSHDG